MYILGTDLGFDQKCMYVGRILYGFLTFIAHTKGIITDLYVKINYKCVFRQGTTAYFEPKDSS